MEMVMDLRETIEKSGLYLAEIKVVVKCSRCGRSWAVRVKNEEELLKLQTGERKLICHTCKNLNLK